MKFQTPVRVTPASEPLITLADAKLHCRVDHDDEDATIAGLVSAVTAYLDGYSGILGRALVLQSWRQDADCFPPGGTLRLPLAPVVSIVSVKYYDGQNVQQTLATSVYSLADDARGPYVHLEYGQEWPATWPREDAVSVTFEAGYGTAADVPGDIVLAAKLLLAHWYENREESIVGTIVASLPMSSRALLAGYRRTSF